MCYLYLLNFNKNLLCLNLIYIALQFFKVIRMCVVYCSINAELDATSSESRYLYIKQVATYCYRK